MGGSLTYTGDSWAASADDAGPVRRHDAPRVHAFVAGISPIDAMLYLMVWLLLLAWLLVAVFLAPVLGRLLASRSDSLSGSPDQQPAAPVDSTL